MITEIRGAQGAVAPRLRRGRRRATMQCMRSLIKSYELSEFVTDQEKRMVMLTRLLSIYPGQVGDGKGEGERARTQFWAADRLRARCMRRLWFRVLILCALTLC